MGMMFHAGSSRRGPPNATYPDRGCWQGSERHLGDACRSPHTLRHRGSCRPRPESVGFNRMKSPVPTSSAASARLHPHAGGNRETNLQFLRTGSRSAKAASNSGARMSWVVPKNGSSSRSSRKISPPPRARSDGSRRASSALAESSRSRRDWRQPCLGTT